MIKTSVFLGALLLFGRAQAAEEFYAPLRARQQPSLYAATNGYSDSQLLKSDPNRLGGWIEFKRAEPRYEKNALTIRFGAPTEKSPSKVVVQAGRAANLALFVAAVIVTFLL